MKETIYETLTRIWIIAVLVLLIVVFGIIIFKEVTNREPLQNDEIVYDDVPYYGAIEMTKQNPQIRISSTDCWEVTCGCAKNTSTPCLAYCFECKDEIWENWK